MARQVVDLVMVYKRETDDAVCVSIDEEHEDVWLPKRAVEWEFNGKVTSKTKRRLVDVTLREDLAIEKGLY